MAIAIRSRQELLQHVLAVLQSYIAEKSVVLALDMPIEAVEIDSFDIMHTIFKLEDDLDTGITFTPSDGYRTVGDLVGALADAIQMPALPSA